MRFRTVIFGAHIFAISALIAALDLANINRIQAEYCTGTANLQEVVEKLESVWASIEVNPIGGVLDDVNGALKTVNTMAEMISHLPASGRCVLAGTR